ncbi:hypothetical protein ABZ990_05690 [Streptomyces sp. NPDC046203]|uniref:hypothetical protein n=1 Tax=Streptomyces sp. NPDC046203 TaxID=3154602 RepID=UPI0033C8384A
MESYATEHDTGLRSSPGGDLYVETFAIEPGAQRAGDSVAGTSRGIAPAEVWRHW